MANTYSLISTQTVPSGGAASIVFSNIPQTFDDLVLHVSTRYDSTNQTQSLTFNSDTTNANYNRGFYGMDLGAGTIFNYNIADRGGAGLVNLSSYTASVFASSKFYIGNYKSSTLNKSYIVYAGTENQAAASFGAFVVNRWTSTAAISTIALSSNGTFSQHSTASLYGISTTV